MTTKPITALLCALALPALAGDDAGLIKSAESAAPASVTAKATIKTMDGKVLRQGSNGWVCYPGDKNSGPMCNMPGWDKLFEAYMKKGPLSVDGIAFSYMLAGEGEAPGVSNIDPFATAPTPDNDWIKEGPHLMILVPDPALLEGLPTDPSEPVYVMWKGTPYAHIMVRIKEQ
ncbi:hypothetical protein [Gallaecimonas sp. GXIMD4217]|uniref:hypothetical protein n=1 Tax=Gallaecimonas sp. GXIMD4217 TaxID=3131927 RepID=UPI00311B2536